MAGKKLTLFYLLLTNVAEGVLPRIQYQMSGDLIIGGLIPLHNYDDISERCASRRDIGSLRLVEALVYSITTVNQDTERLNGITLGYEIYDTCSSGSETLKNSLAFVPSLRDKDNVLGVVGPQRSSSSIQATKLLGLYNISIISYLSTSDELSNSVRYPYFYRMVPPDIFQVGIECNIQYLTAGCDIMNKIYLIWLSVILFYDSIIYYEIKINIKLKKKINMKLEKKIQGNVFTQTFVGEPGWLDNSLLTCLFVFRLFNEAILVMTPASPSI